MLLSSCAKPDTPEIQVRDWDGTSTYFASSDASFHTYYKPAAGFVGDPMPFYDPVAKDFKVMYLQDYRPNPAGTYHPIWAVSTKDAANYVSMGELISCGNINDQDAAIGTGSTVYNEKDGLYYTFYTGNKHMPKENESGQVVMLATSSDFKTWKKDRTVFIKGEDNGYSKNDFRDPFVFADDEGLWHMIVAATRNGKGWLVEYTSTDLLSWECKGDFMMMVWDRFYECPDIFKMGDWWYMIYSEKHHAIRKVQYFKGKTLEDLVKSTENDSPVWPDSREGYLDSRGFYAGKTASDGVNRYIWGWCPTRPGRDNTDVGESPREPEWAGNLVAHKIIQHEDGTLTLGAVESIDAKYTEEKTVKAMEQSAEGVSFADGKWTLAENAFVLFNRLSDCNKISFKVKASAAGSKFGISVVRGSDSKKYYTMVVNPEDGGKRKINFEQEGEEGKGFIGGIDGYLFDKPEDDVYDVTIYTDNSILVMYINDDVAYTNRIYGMAKNCWSINTYGGSAIEVSDIRVFNQK